MAGVDILATAFNGANAAYLADLYARWAADPGAVDPSFSELFSALGEEARSVLGDAAGASWAPRPNGAATKPNGHAAAIAATLDEVRAAARDSLRALMLIRAYRVRGHLEAKLDPLGLQVPKSHAELDPATYGFAAGDLDRPIFIDHVLGRETATVREIMRIVRESYCGPIGVEFMHIQDPDQKAWIQRRIEGAPWRGALSAEEKRAVLQQLTEAEGFEAFCRAARHHQALRPGRQRGADPGDARADRCRCGRRRQGNRDRDAASRPAQHAGQHRAQAVHRRVQRVRRHQLKPDDVRAPAT